MNLPARIRWIMLTGLAILLLTLVLQPVSPVSAVQPRPPTPPNRGKVQQYQIMAGPLCTIYAADPTPHTHTISGYGSQTCSQPIQQTVRVCVQVQRQFIIYYWATLGCIDAAGSGLAGGFGWTVYAYTPQFGYDYGTHLYRTYVTATSTYNGVTSYPPTVYSNNISITY